MDQMPAKFFYRIERFLTTLTYSRSGWLIARSGSLGCICDNRPLTIFP